MTYAYYPQGGELAFEPTQGIANTTISVNVSTENLALKLGLGLPLGIFMAVCAGLGLYIKCKTYHWKKNERERPH